MSSSGTRCLSVGVSLVCLIAVVCQVSNVESADQAKPKKGGGPPHNFIGGPAEKPALNVVLGRPTDRGVTVSVMANGETEVQIAYGDNKNSLTKKSAFQKLTPNTPVQFVLDDLKSDTRYYYTVQSKTAGQQPGAAETTRTFHTQRRPGSPFVFALQADSHLDQGTVPKLYEQTLANVVADQADFHIDLGDTFMTDKYPQATDALPQYLAQRYYLGQMAHSVPLFLVLGNHDGERVDRFDGTLDCMPAWSCLTRKKYFPNPYPNSFYSGSTRELRGIGRLENYYAFQWGDALFVALDPFWTTPRKKGKDQSDNNWHRTLGEEQYHWLEKTLSGSTAKFKFVFIHHLVGGLDESARGGAEAALLYEWGGQNSSGTDEFKTQRPGWTMPIHALLAKYHVSVVFHGHDHFYAKQMLGNVVYLMVPQPGHPDSGRPLRPADYGYLRGEFLPPAGHIRVTVTPDKATVAYVRSYVTSPNRPDDRNRQIADTFSIAP